MDDSSFDALARMVATVTSRRSLLRRLAGGAVGALALGATPTISEAAKVHCRPAGYRCNSTEMCCEGLICGTDHTCRPGLGGSGCGGDFADCGSDSDCCSGYACTQGYCSTCSGAGGFCDNYNGLIICCNGLTCSSNGTCLCRNQGERCSGDSDCCGTLVCGSSGVCVGGSVGAPCGSSADCTRGLTCCSGICADLQSDAKNCGSCGNACSQQTGGSVPVCAGGTCGIQCNPGLSLCSSGAGKYCCSKCCPTVGGTVCC